MGFLRAFPTAHCDALIASTNLTRPAELSTLARHRSAAEALRRHDRGWSGRVEMQVREPDLFDRASDACHRDIDDPRSQRLAWASPDAS